MRRRRRRNTNKTQENIKKKKKKKIKISLCGLVVNTHSSYSEAPGTNLGLETGYPDIGFSGFPQYIQANAGIIP
jgi:hypothetical protein